MQWTRPTSLTASSELPKKVRFGAALQLGFIRMSGATLDVFDYVSRPVLQAEATTSVFRWLSLPIVAVPWGYVFDNYIYKSRKQNA